MAFFEGCPVGWGGYPPELGGRPRALIPGEGVREGLWAKVGWVCTGAGLVVREAGQGLGGGARASVPGGGRW